MWGGGGRGGGRGRYQVRHQGKRRALHSAFQNRCRSRRVAGLVWKLWKLFTASKSNRFALGRRPHANTICDAKCGWCVVWQATGVLLLLAHQPPLSTDHPQSRVVGDPRRDGFFGT